jgi:hypothetical protein
MRAGLAHDTHIEVYKITKDKLNFKEYMMSQEMLKQVMEVKDNAESED